MKICNMLWRLLLLFSTAVQAEQVILDKIIVVVDDDIILESELNIRRQALLGQLQSQNKPLPQEDILNQQIIDRLIIESLQLQMAEHAGVKISDEELNATLANIAQQNNMTLAEFSVEVERGGISYLEMRDQIRREIAIMQVQQGVMRNRINIAEQEIKVFLDSEMGQILTADEYRLAHILLPIPEKATSSQIRKVKQAAESLMQELVQGSDFQSLAIERSAASDALEGGDLGWRKAVQLPTMFANIATQMAVGEIHGPIKSGSGYHVIKLVQKRGAEVEGQVAQTRVRHVLIQPSEILSQEEAQDLAQSLREEVINGRPFAEIAKLHSDDPGSALNGGDLGWSRQGIFVPEFEHQMNNTKIDEISPVFYSSHGYHFLEVMDRRVADFSKEFKMGQAENHLRRQKMNDELESWIREIRDGAFIEIRS